MYSRGRMVVIAESSAITIILPVKPYIKQDDD